MCERFCVSVWPLYCIWVSEPEIGAWHLPIVTGIDGVQDHTPPECYPQASVKFKVKLHGDEDTAGEHLSWAFRNGQDLAVRSSSPRRILIVLSLHMGLSLGFGPTPGLWSPDWLPPLSPGQKWVEWSQLMATSVPGLGAAAHQGMAPRIFRLLWSSSFSMIGHTCFSASSKEAQLCLWKWCFGFFFF